MNNQLVVMAQMEDPVSRQVQAYQFKHTYHSLERASQRSIGREKLSLTLAYGETYYRQGLIFYVLGEKNLPDNLRKKADAKNIIVVVNGDSGIILTCYRNPTPHKFIRLKSKRLYRLA